MKIRKDLHKSWVISWSMKGEFWVMWAVWYLEFERGHSRQRMLGRNWEGKGGRSAGRERPWLVCTEPGTGGADLEGSADIAVQSVVLRPPASASPMTDEECRIPGSTVTYWIRHSLSNPHVHCSLRRVVFYIMWRKLVFFFQVSGGF